MQIKLCKLHNAKQIIRDKLRKYIKNHQLSQMNGPTRPERAEAPSPGRALKKVPNFKLHSLFLNFNSCPRSISSFKSGILFWTGI